MANWNVLKAAVNNVIKANSNQEITGQLLQNVLNNIITNVGENATFAGIATPETNPGSPDGNVFYLATTAGTYSNFNGIVINSGEAIILEWKGSWVKKDSGFSTKEKLSELEENTNQKISKSEENTNQKISELGSKLIKIYKFDTDLGNTPIGEVYYNTNSHKLTKSIGGGLGETVPFISGSIYTYNNDLYIYDLELGQLIPYTFGFERVKIANVSELDNITEKGIYLYEKRDDVYQAKICLVGRNGNNINQLLITSNGEVKHRASINEGVSWSAWIEMYDQNEIDKYRHLFSDDYIQFDENIGRLISFNVSSSNTFTREGVIMVVPLIDSCIRIVTLDMRTNVSFLKSLPTDIAEGVDISQYFAYGEVGRRQLEPNTEYIFNEISNDAKYALILAYSSTGIKTLPKIYTKSLLSELASIKYPFDINKETMNENFLISKSSNTWVEGANGCYILEIPPRANMRIKANSNSSQIALLKDRNVVIGNTPNYIDGYSSVIDLAANASFYFDNKDEICYLYIIARKYDGGGNWTSLIPGVYYSYKIEDAINDLRKNNSLNGQTIKDGVITLTDMPNLSVISDSFKSLSSGECNVVYEKETGLVYVTAIEGEDNVYEALDNEALYIFSVTNPNQVKRYQYATKKSSTQQCYGNNVILIGRKKVRVFYSIKNENSDGGKLYYRDFDFNTETFTEPISVKIGLDELTSVQVENLTVNAGFPSYGKDFVYLQKITNAVDGYRYATCLCSESISYNPLVIRSNDNFATCEFVMVFPYQVRYDCLLAALGDYLYFVHRIGGDEYANTSGTAFACYNIVSKQWTCESIKFAEGDSRPDCYEKNGKIYLFAGNYHSIPNVPRRTSSSIWEGTSTSSVTEYIKKVIVNDSRGVQNPRMFIYGAGDYGILLQNSPSRIDYENGYQGQWQFKTALCYVTTRID